MEYYIGIPLFVILALLVTWLASRVLESTRKGSLLAIYELYDVCLLFFPPVMFVMLGIAYLLGRLKILEFNGNPPFIEVILWPIFIAVFFWLSRKILAWEIQRRQPVAPVEYSETK
jgi:hypothetical protein